MDIQSFLHKTELKPRTQNEFNRMIEQAEANAKQG